MECVAGLEPHLGRGDGGLAFSDDAGRLSQAAIHRKHSQPLGGRAVQRAAARWGRTGLAAPSPPPTPVPAARCPVPRRPPRSRGSARRGRRPPVGDGAPWPPSPGVSTGDPVPIVVHPCRSPSRPGHAYCCDLVLGAGRDGVRAVGGEAVDAARREVEGAEDLAGRHLFADPGDQQGPAVRLSTVTGLPSRSPYRAASSGWRSRWSTGSSLRLPPRRVMLPEL